MQPIEWCYFVCARISELNMQDVFTRAFMEKDGGSLSLITTSFSPFPIPGSSDNNVCSRPIKSPPGAQRGKKKTLCLRVWYTCNISAARVHDVAQHSNRNKRWMSGFKWSHAFLKPRTPEFSSDFITSANILNCQISFLKHTGLFYSRLCEAEMPTTMCLHGSSTAQVSTPKSGSSILPTQQTNGIFNQS